MKPFTSVTSDIVPLPWQDIDTDMIIPAQYLTQVSTSGYGQHLFARFKADPDFVLNQACYQHARLLVAGANFGCGSSREHAVWALLEAGFQVVIAPSFSDIFFNNAAKNGLLLVRMDQNVVDQWVEKAKSRHVRLTVDLKHQMLEDQDGQRYWFEYDAFRKYCLLNGLDDMDYLLSKKDVIDKQETIIAETRFDVC